MIQAKDLRLENYVIYSDTQTLFEVTDINSTDSVGIGVKNDEEQTWIELDQFEPIPLSPSILEQAGFESHPSVPVYQLILEEQKVDIMFFSMECSLLPEGVKASDKIKLPHIKYLHQLQNLFYSLTGSELNLNLCTPTNPQEQQ